MAFATTEGTQSYFEKYPSKGQPRKLGKTGLWVSPVGFGSYRVSDQTPSHADAMIKALLSGCNLIDTSANYAFGGSERLVGRVLRQLTADGQLKRDQVVVVTKVGYVQGENLILAKERIAQGKPFAEVVHYKDDCWHCISPEFIEDQLNRSLSRLGLETLDILLLHNPEYYLKTQANPEEYYRRIQVAFEYLEKEVARGRIKYYGISSNSFPYSLDAPEHTSLSLVQSIAEKLGPDHHFAVIQFPFNLYEAGAVLEKNNDDKTLVEFAMDHQIGTLTNRPLNAFTHNRLLRLADPPSSSSSYRGFLDSQLTVESSRIIKELERVCPALKESKTLSQKALRVYLSTQGLDCILVGMRKISYVEEVFSGLAAPQVSSEVAQSILKAFAT